MEKVEMTEKQEKLVKLMKNREFVDKVMSQESVSDVQKLFRSEGIELSETDIEALGDIIDIALQKGEILNDEILDNVSAGISKRGAMAVGGVVGTLVGAIGGGVLGGRIGASTGDFTKELAVYSFNKKMEENETMDQVKKIAEKKGMPLDKALILSGAGIGAVSGVGVGAGVGAAAGIAIARSLCKWKER